MKQNDLESQVHQAVEVLKSIESGSNRGFVKNLIALFLKESPKLLDQCEQALTAKEATVLQKSAHSLKSSLASFGAQTAAKIALEIEEKAGQGSLHGLAPLLSQIRLEFEKVRIILQSSDV